MAHSLIPIVVGYIFAHYLSYLVERGQQAVFALADPLGRGWNPLGLAHMHVAYVLSAHPRCWPPSRWRAWSPGTSSR